MQLIEGERLSEPTFTQTILLAAGGGAIAGLLIGISTVKETVEAQRAERQRDTLLFVNELLRHDFLNGMQVVEGNAGTASMGTPRSSSSRRTAQLATVVGRSVSEARGAAPDAELTIDVPDDVEVDADDLLGPVLENLLSNAVDHNDADTPQVQLETAVKDDIVLLFVRDDGPGIPAAEREACFEAGLQGDSRVVQGLALPGRHTRRAVRWLRPDRRHQAGGHDRDGRTPADRALTVRPPCRPRSRRMPPVRPPARAPS